MALDNDSNEMNILLSDTSFIDSNFEQQFDFAFNDYRYEENRTPCSSPASSASALQSPYSMQADMNPRSPPVTAKDFTQFFEASNPVSQAFEADFSELTLTDNEQRELYQAAKCIQKAYRSYKGRKKMEEKDLHAHCTRKDKEKNAAIIIQNYYRRYKEYAYYREMTHAALGKYLQTSSTRKIAQPFRLFFQWFRTSTDHIARTKGSNSRWTLVVIPFYLLI